MGRINGGGGGSVPGIKRMGPNIDRMAGSGADSMERMGAGLGHGMDHVGSETECMVLVMDHMGSCIEHMDPLGLEHMGQIMERISSGMERMCASMVFGHAH